MSGMDVWQQRRLKSYVRFMKFYGRFADFSVEHLGRFDTWVSTRIPGAAAASGADGPEPEHYTLDVYTNPKIAIDSKVHAAIRLRAGAGGARSVSFRLSPVAKVSAVSDASGQPLDFIRTEGALHVFLPEPAGPGAVFEIRVDYEGDLVEPVDEDGSYVLMDTTTWFPHTGRTDRATYDVTLRRPARFQELASGRVVESGEKDGVAWERRTLDLPALGFTFEIGRFDVVHDQAGHVELTFGFPRVKRHTPGVARETIVRTVKQCLPFYEKEYGPYPLDYLTVVTASRGFSQGLLSMVTLAQSDFQELDEDASDVKKKGVEERRLVTVAHEVSHQWWGNWVGWASYHDQWLSEALAQYSALRFGTEMAASKAAFLVRNACDWRSSLTAWTNARRPVAELGPVTLGQRLDSSKSENGYDAIAYDKGSVVLRMLARIVGEGVFDKMLGVLAKAVGNHTIDTATFLEAIEKMSQQDLTPFADQFIYGTALPDVWFHYGAEPATDGKGWTIRGEARQVASWREDLKIAGGGEGGWRVERSKAAVSDVVSSTLVVPFQVILPPKEKEGTKPEADKKAGVRTARGFGGILVLKGALTPFKFTLPEKPERLVLDQLGEALALFHDEGMTPKDTLFKRADEAGDEGNEAGAEKLFDEALAAPLYSESAIAEMTPTRKKNFKKEIETNREDARIHTLLARLALDRGDTEGAEKEIAAAEGLLAKPEDGPGWLQREILHARIELARGDPKAAYKRLDRTRRRWWLNAEGYAWLAVAANESGHDRRADEALKRAEARGVDVGALRSARAASR